MCAVREIVLIIIFRFHPFLRYFNDSKKATCLLHIEKALRDLPANTSDPANSMC